MQGGSVEAEALTELVNLWQVVWSRKHSILMAAAVCGFAAAACALLATPSYRAQVVLTEVHDRSMTAAAAHASQLGGLTRVLRPNPPAAGGPGREAQVVLRSRRLVEEFIKRNDLISKLFPQAKRPPTLRRAVRQFRERVLSIREDKLKGTTTVAIDWTDPALAAGWANGFVALANELVRARAQGESRHNIAYLEDQIARTNRLELQNAAYDVMETETETLMLASSGLDYAFVTVDPAVRPEMRRTPQRTLMVLLGSVAGIAACVSSIFWRYALNRCRDEILRDALYSSSWNDAADGKIV